MSRLWGEWESRFYGSGTTIVALKHGGGKPYLYIYADASKDESRYMADRFAMCNQIEAYLNGGCERQEWLSDFERRDEHSAESLSGAQIYAAGPSVDIDPPNLNWRQDDSEEAKSDRARLMDALFLTT